MQLSATDSNRSHSKSKHKKKKHHKKKHGIRSSILFSDNAIDEDLATMSMDFDAVQDGKSAKKNNKLGIPSMLDIHSHHTMKHDAALMSIDLDLQMREMNNKFNKNNNNKNKAQPPMASITEEDSVANMLNLINFSSNISSQTQTQIRDPLPSFSMDHSKNSSRKAKKQVTFNTLAMHDSASARSSHRREQSDYDSFYDDSLKRRSTTNNARKSGTKSSRDILLLNQWKKPYVDTFLGRLEFDLESIAVINVRIYAFVLLLFNFAPRFLMVFDIYTDIIVCLELYYKSDEKLWFSATCLFIILPFVLVWAASLRFIQRRVEMVLQLHFESNGKQYLVYSLINVFMILYMFPPIGTICVALWEAYLLITALYAGMKGFILGTGLVQNADRELQALIRYRKAIEIFAESIPQTMLQLYIFLQVRYSDQNEETSYDPIDLQDLTISMGVSTLNLIYSGIAFKREANLHGMLFSEYALSVLQLAEVPISKFVPRLSAIKKGMVEEANFIPFKFDKAAVTPLLEALNSDECKLKTIKISVGSLSKLDLSSCKMLGYLLVLARVEVIVSRISSLMDTIKIFNRFDHKNKGYLIMDEFVQMLIALNSPLANEDAKEQQRIFETLAIRRNKKRDRIYFFDIFHKTADLKCESKKHQVFALDVTQIDYPLHFIFETIQQSIEENDDKNITKMITNMHKLFHFCDGLGIDTQIDATLDEHVFFAVLNALYAIDGVEMSDLVKKKQNTIWFFFIKLLQKTDSFDVDFYLHRNKIFHFVNKSKQSVVSMQSSMNNTAIVHNTTPKTATSEQKDDEQENNENIETKLEKAKDWVLKLKTETFELGINIFEYCFFFKEGEQKYNKCRAFVYLFDAFLKSLRLHHLDDDDHVNKLLNDKESDKSLMILFRETMGFHVKDENDYTPLYYACKEGLDDVIAFFAKFVFNKEIFLSLSPQISMISTEQKDEEEEDEEENVQKNDDDATRWIFDQDYLHSLLDALFISNAINPNPKSLKLLLSTDQILVNYKGRKNGPLAHHLVDIRQSAFERKDEYHTAYIMRCIYTLCIHGYDFVNNKDQNENNILHKAVLCNDIELIEKFIKKDLLNKSLKQLLNDTNKDGRMPFHIAMDLCLSEIANVLLKLTEQCIHFEPFLNVSPSIDSLWIKCFVQMLRINETPKNQLTISLYSGFMQKLAMEHLEEGKKLLDHAERMIKKVDKNHKATKQTYEDLDKIINFLYARLGIEREQASSGLSGISRQVGKVGKHMHKKGKKELKKNKIGNPPYLNAANVSAKGASIDLEEMMN